MRYAWRDPQLDDGVLRADFWLAPGKAGPPDHINPLFAEHCTVVSGTADFRLGDRRWRAVAGEQAVLPPGVPHNFRNAGSDELQVFVEGHPNPDAIYLASVPRALQRGFTKLLARLGRMLGYRP
jgi:uncharacterized cupin superfamily protein